MKTDNIPHLKSSYELLKFKTFNGAMRSIYRLANVFIPAKARFIFNEQNNIYILVICLIAISLFAFKMAFVLGLIPIAAAINYHNKWKKTKERQRKLNEQIIDVIELISNSLGSGMTFYQSLNEIVNNIPQPSSGIFRDLLNKHNLGMPLDAALNEMAELNKNKYLDVFVVSITLTRETGGNLTEVLKKLAADIREDFRLEGHIEVLTAQGRLSGWILGLMPLILAVLIFLIDKELIKPLFTTTQGILMIFAAILLEITGVFIIKKIINIDI